MKVYRIVLPIIIGIAVVVSYIVFEFDKESPTTTSAPVTGSAPSSGSNNLNFDFKR